LVNYGWTGMNAAASVIDPNDNGHDLRRGTGTRKMDTHKCSTL